MTAQRDEGFPDQHLVNHVRDALWRRPGAASVMVGSGFSRNARKAHPDAAEIPLWPDLEAELEASLPGSHERLGDGAEGQQEPGSGDALDLAQKYESAFGRARLHEFLVRSIRDESFRPGELHRRLLALPWQDVFTTNWDTLLERCLPLPERAYGVVTSADHLPIVAPPRIVKLHGSLPGTFPLVVTKRDYEGYPDRFAPFVNTAQQAMMETVFLLLGFSGKDPNFVKWTDWVYENLQENMPRIYVANWLGLDDDARASLEDRNVVPIDLARHPKALDWPEPLRRAKAAEWLLLSLEHGRPYPAEDWPQPVAPRPRAVPEDLMPVDSCGIDGPHEEPRDRPQGDSDETDDLEKVREVLRTWRRNRRCYPSWLVMPFERATYMRFATERWEPSILKALPHLEGVTERLGALRELVWRREAQLDPLSELPELADSVAEVLDEIDCEQRLVGGEERNDLDWNCIRQQWRTAAAALLTAARFSLDREKLEHWFEELRPFFDEDAELAERARHERCLWSLNHHDFEQLEALVDEWRPQAADPAWLLRKAALLAELGRSDEARELALGVLETVRKWPTDSASFAGPSREAWALSLVEATHEHRGDVASRHRELQSRFRELAPYRCDPRGEFSDHERAVSAASQGREYKPFDLSFRNVKGLFFSKVNVLRALAALRAIRFTEVVGTPSVVSGDLLVRAAEALLPYRPRWSSVLSIGLASEEAKRRFSRTLSRWRIACMDPDLALSLAKAQHRTVAFALERLDQRKDTLQGWWIWRHRLEAAVEALSRFVLRLEPAEVEHALALAQDLYRDSRVRSDLSLVGAVSHLLSRSWEALPLSFKDRHALDLLRLPIPGVDGFTVDGPDHLTDPGRVLHSDRGRLPEPERTTENEAHWAEVVRLVAEGLRSEGTARKRAAIRFVVMAEWQNLTPNEQEYLREALWSSGIDDQGLPPGTGLQPWALLSLLEPESGIAEKRLRASWSPPAGWENEGAGKLEKVLSDAGSALENLRNSGREIELAAEEEVSLVRALERWAASGPATVLPWEGNQRVRSLRRAFRNVSALLLELDLSEATAQVLLGHVRSLATTKTPAYEFLPGIVKADPQKLREAASLLRVGLGGATSKQRPQAVSACEGLYRWLRATGGDSAVPVPPTDLVFELGVIISAHRWCALPNTLAVAAWIFKNGTAEHRELLASPCLQGLASLRKVLAFREEPDSHGFGDGADVVSEDEADVPWLRYCCFKLAIAMDLAGFGKETAVAGWLGDAESDPLPEIRFAMEELRARG
ncbi:MAG: SIR2 family protein [Acidobacteria bacterium]|nr:SIR2 family protein [Acidobacteriota bacterium]